MSRKTKGPLIIIGGREEIGDGQNRAILNEVVRCAARGKKGLLVVTVATHLHEELGPEYVRAFKALGMHHVDVLDVRTRGQAFDPKNLEMLDGACAVYFTGGDQLRITSQIGGTPLFHRMTELHESGGVIAGTSAGAAAVPDTMLISGNGKESPRVASLGMAPGLGILKGVVVDSHFAERGRLGRLLAAVAQNPANLGLGIDENTAVVVEDERRFRVIGTGAVYVIDGGRISYSSLSEETPQHSLSIHDLSLHVLADGDRYDLTTRRPSRGTHAGEP
ncbi:MAG TPA: cyanophycinase [Tepidisphaeraceae bacterium]|nr:cyanophycinase [Tepidisphaeraceae bacterium]